ncbi:DUF4935 domain-containing protein [Pseudomonas sp. P155]|uniref:DUF4935 domain-containing protein n=1 Tax=Pseudomonas neuropathica TaxID=2730425 RepID=A0ABS0BKK2_9PSED|nr:PIN-like domain-containing protein [Pseudomonas neuropathica]MBF6033081.1 DUF4935 domain-containing protein [Pseudomonas neuropathica]
MRSLFPGQFANEPEKLKGLWEGGIIALDANVLLDLYRYSDSTRAALINVLELLKDRIWVSNQVAKEYFSNRLKLIGDQAKLYDGAIADLVKLKSGFENQKQHPFIGAQALEGFVDSFCKVVDELKVNKEIHDRRIYEDDIKDKLADLFEGRVGEGYEVERLEDIVTEGIARYQQKIPPGFKDAAKGGDGVTLSDRCAPYGDYIGWLQLIEKSKEEGVGVIYVTGDVKEDWWLKQSGKTVGPLPELIEEFILKTSNSFYMYQPDRFLEYANGFLHQEASPEAVEEIRETRLEETISNSVAESFVNKSINRTISRALNNLYRGDDAGGVPEEPSFYHGLTESECKAYIANLSFRRDLAKSSLDRRYRDLDLINLGGDVGRDVSEADVFEEVRSIEQNIKVLNSRLAIANNYLAALIEEQ